MIADLAARGVAGRARSATVAGGRTPTSAAHPVSSLGVIAWQLSASKGPGWDQATQELQLVLVWGGLSGPQAG